MLFLILMFSFTGCGEKNQENSQSNETTQQTGEDSEKPSSHLEDMDQTLEKIIFTLHGPSTGAEEEEGAKGNEGSGGSEGSDGSGESEATGESEGTGKSEGAEKSKEAKGTQQQSTSPAGTPSSPSHSSPWEDISPMIKKIHSSWNRFVPTAAEQGAGKELLDKFSDQLNSLTNQSLTKNQTATLLAANRLYGSLTEFYPLFKTKNTPEIKKIRYYVRNTILTSDGRDWRQAELDIKNAKSSWELIKNTIPKAQQNLINIMDFSLYDFEKVVTEQNSPLVRIKGNVVLSNIDALEKASNKAEEKETE